MNNSSKDFSPGLSLVAQFLDLAGILALAIGIYTLYLNNQSFTREYSTALIFTSLLTLFVFPKFGVYLSWRGRSKFKRLRVITSAWITVITILVISSVILKNSNHYSRVWFFSWSLSSLIYLISIRHLVDYVLSKFRKKGWNKKNIIVFGAGKLGNRVAENLLKAEWTGFNILSFFDDLNKEGSSILNIPILKSSELKTFVESNNIQELWITLPLREEQRVRSLLHELRHLTLSIKYVPDIFGFRILNQKATEIAGIPIMQLNTTPMHGVNILIKELEDKILSLLILLFISPLMLLVAIAIKIESKGPIFFKQRRHGWNGKEIKVYKFRSMKLHNEEKGHVTQAKKFDSRITKVGAFIRRTSLDELPQFFNVLQGRMSIVGPRPHALAHNEEYKDQVEYYMQRHRVKPGITGWAQINGLRGETDTLDKMSQRVEYDLFYIENWSLAFDLKIIILTIFKGFINKNAY